MAVDLDANLVSTRDTSQSANDSLDQRLAEPGRDDLGIGRHSEDDTERELVRSGVETTERLAKDVRQHRDGSLSEVNGRRPLLRLSIQRSVGLHDRFSR